jgi:hypothetical protein
LVKQAGKQRGNDDARRVVTGRQPEIDRKRGRLHGECQKEQAGQRHQRRAVGEFACLGCDIGHVERAEDGIKDADRYQEQGGSDEVEDGVFHRAVDLDTSGADDQQAEGRNQQHLEPDVEIEEIAGQEGAADACHQHQQQREETVAAAGIVDINECVEAAGKGCGRRRQRHDGAEDIDGEGDAEGRQPAAHDHGHRPVCHHLPQQGGVDHGEQRQAGYGDCGLQARRGADDQQDSGKCERQHDRGDDQPVGDWHRGGQEGGGEIGDGLGRGGHSGGGLRPGGGGRGMGVAAWFESWCRGMVAGRWRCVWGTPLCPAGHLPLKGGDRIVVGISQNNRCWSERLPPADLPP